MPSSTDILPSSGGLASEDCHLASPLAPPPPAQRAHAGGAEGKRHPQGGHKSQKGGRRDKLVLPALSFPCPSDGFPQVNARFIWPAFETLNLLNLLGCVRSHNIRNSWALVQTQTGAESAGSALSVLGESPQACWESPMSVKGGS